MNIEELLKRPISDFDRMDEKELLSALVKFQTFTADGLVYLDALGKSKETLKGMEETNGDSLSFAKEIIPQVQEDVENLILTEKNFTEYVDYFTKESKELIDRHKALSMPFKYEKAEAKLKELDVLTQQVINEMNKHVVQGLKECDMSEKQKEQEGQVSDRGNNEALEMVGQGISRRYDQLKTLQQPQRNQPVPLRREKEKRIAEEERIAMETEHKKRMRESTEASSNLQALPENASKLDPSNFSKALFRK